MRTLLGRSAAPLLESDAIVAPELLDAEVLSALRRRALRGATPADECQQALARLVRWPLVRLTHGPFLARAFELCFNYSAYDALYVAVAERLGATLVTCDGPLARAPAIAGLQIRNVTLLQ